jgi:hypothetical protein
MKAKRVTSVAKRISRFPYRYHAVDDAYAQFINDGTLPEDLTLSAAVMHRVLKARKPDPETDAWRRDLITSGRMRQPYGCTREMFFAEACCEDKAIRKFARFLLQAVVQAGHDPTDPDMIGYELEPDDYAPVCMRLVGYPHDFVRPEYGAQIERVQRQRNQVADQRPAGEHWDRGARKAVSAFMKKGEIPTDALHYLHALSVGETFALVAHYYGKGGEDLLAAYETAATSTGPDRAAALQRLSELQARSEMAIPGWRIDDARS